MAIIFHFSFAIGLCLCLHLLYSPLWLLTIERLMMMHTIIMVPEIHWIPILLIVSFYLVNVFFWWFSKDNCFYGGNNIQMKRYSNLFNLSVIYSLTNLYLISSPILLLWHNTWKGYFMKKIDCFGGLICPIAHVECVCVCLCISIFGLFHSSYKSLWFSHGAIVSTLLNLLA